MATRIDPAVSRDWMSRATLDELECALAAYETQAEVSRDPWKRERAAVTAGMIEAEIVERHAADYAERRAQTALTFAGV